MNTKCSYKTHLCCRTTLSYWLSYSLILSDTAKSYTLHYTAMEREEEGERWIPSSGDTLSAQECWSTVFNWLLFFAVLPLVLLWEGFISLLFYLISSSQLTIFGLGMLEWLRIVSRRTRAWPVLSSAYTDLIRYSREPVSLRIHKIATMQKMLEFLDGGRICNQWWCVISFVSRNWGNLQKYHWIAMMYV